MLNSQRLSWSTSCESLAKTAANLVEAIMVYSKSGMVFGFFFGVKGHANAGGFEHGNVVGAVAHGDDLLGAEP